MNHFIVVCRNDRNADGTTGPYGLATRRVFTSEAAAKDYAAGVSPSREPLVVQGSFDTLRFEDDSL